MATLVPSLGRWLPARNTTSSRGTRRWSTAGRPLVAGGRPPLAIRKSQVPTSTENEGAAALTAAFRRQAARRSRRESPSYHFPVMPRGLELHARRALRDHADHTATGAPVFILCDESLPLKVPPCEVIPVRIDLRQRTRLRAKQREERMRGELRHVRGSFQFDCVPALRMEICTSGALMTQKPSSG